MQSVFGHSFYRLLTCCAYLLILTGCGGGKVAANQPQYSGDTYVSIMASAAANDQLSAAALSLSSITLIGESGGTATVSLAGSYASFIPISGYMQPLLSSSIPQGVYTSAVANIIGAYFECNYFVSGNPGTLNFSPTGVSPLSQSEFPINLPSPITITGTGMTLNLNLNVAQSFNWSPGYCGASESYIPSITVNPDLSLTAMPVPSETVSTGNNKFHGLIGQILTSSTNNTSFHASFFGASDFEVYTGTNTVYQGIPAISSLSAGMPFDMDGIVQPNGYLLANRIEVLDASTSNLSYAIVDLATTGATYKSQSGLVDFLLIYGSGIVWGGGLEGDDIGCFGCGTLFSISEEITNLNNLPFPATFTSANMVAGQRSW